MNPGHLRATDPDEQTLRALYRDAEISRVPVTRLCYQASGSNGADKKPDPLVSLLTLSGVRWLDITTAKGVPGLDELDLEIELLNYQALGLFPPAELQAWSSPAGDGFGFESQPVELHELVKPVTDVRDAAQGLADPAPLIELLEEVLALEEANEFEHDLPSAAAPEVAPVPAADASAVAPVVGRSAPTLERSAAMKVLKVDAQRINTLMDSAGELVVAKNALPFLAKRAAEGTPPDRLCREIKEQYAVINRIAESVQQAVMQVRMVPLSQVFRRFPRMVRDLSSRLDKQITLRMEGEETEADKDVIEDLFEPLVHLMRNSIDHGIEPPEVRAARGKKASGTISLSAYQTEDELHITLEDDGKGLDPEALRRRAVSQGLISEEQAQLLDDRQAARLVFAPGLSTANKISDLSGRGVGMDVVKTMVDEAGGSIEIHSELGRGTKIHISLPLTLAVNHVMMVQAGGIEFGVPFASITETVRLPTTRIKVVGSREAVVLRGRVMPLLRLDEVLGLEVENADPETVGILVVSVKGDEFGLVVSRVHEGIDVMVKPMSGVLQSCRLYSGTALLGDGRVLLILNLSEVVRRRLAA